MWVVWLLGCFGPDPRTIEGAFDGAARAIEADDPEQLFRHIDQRAQHALYGVHGARMQAKALIEADYPRDTRARALAALGDAIQADSPAALFGLRCPRACRARIGRQLGAPLEVTPHGDALDVRTARGAHVKVFLGTRGAYGLVFQTAAWMAERDRASRELRQIEDNAAIYRRRRALAGGGPAATAAQAGPDAGRLSAPR